MASRRATLLLWIGLVLLLIAALYLAQSFTTTQYAPLPDGIEDSVRLREIILAMESTVAAESTMVDSLLNDVAIREDAFLLPYLQVRRLEFRPRLRPDSILQADSAMMFAAFTASLRRREYWINRLQRTERGSQTVPRMRGDLAWNSLRGPVGLGDDTLFEEVLDRYMTLGPDTVVAERRGSEQRGAAPGCLPHTGPFVQYDPDFVRSLTSVAVAFIREHERAHFVLGHVKCMPDGRPRYNYVAGSEKAADCWAVAEIERSYPEYSREIIAAVGQAFWSDKKRADGFYESGVSRSIYIRLRCPP